jgi:hypothetical protein
VSAEAYIGRRDSAHQIAGEPFANLPHDLDAERVVLGGILLDNKKFGRVTALIDSGDFYRDAHRRIFRAMLTFNERGDIIDLVTLKDALTRTGEIEDVGGVAYLARLVDGVPKNQDVEAHAGIVKGYAEDRRLVEVADAIKRHAIDGNRDGAFAALAESFGYLTGESAHAQKVQRKLEDLRVLDEAKDLLAREKRGPVPTPAGQGLEKWLAEPDDEMRYRIDDWFPVNGRVVLAAQFKAGKTTLIGNLLRSVVDGDPWLGRYGVTSIDGTAALLDFEMGEPMLKRWLRDQGIERTHQVVVYPLRGKAAAFGITDPKMRAEWATRLREQGVTFLIIDCLKPILDALRLDEKDNIGPFTSALDALLVDAGISECLLVQHMGHANERARGDSSLLGWPEANWNIIRQTDDPASPRFINAFGRDVDIPESQLAYDPATRRLTVAGGSRQDAARARREEASSGRKANALDAICQTLGLKGPLNGTEVKKALKDCRFGRPTVEAALEQGVSEGRLTVTAGEDNSSVYALPR